MRAKLILVLLLICFTSCHPLICTWELRYKPITIEPDQTELIGKYELTHSSKEFLIEQSFSAQEYSLTLSKDGNYKFTNGPDFIFNNYGVSNQKTLNKVGKWFLNCAKSYDCLIELEGVCVVPLSQKDGTLSIMITIGDGDECKGIIYEKMED
jgi:hypothetical protein